MNLKLHKGAFWEGVQMFSLTYTCDACGIAVLLYLGAASGMPLSIALAELLVDAEENHACRATKPPPPIEDPERLPY